MNEIKHLNNNKVEICGKIYSLGIPPLVLRECGFHSRAEVAQAARKHAQDEPQMQLDDVVAYFDGNRR